MNFNSELRGNCILCAEDNEVNRIVLEHTLAEQAVPSVIVTNGAEALKGWQELEPRLILMDISMPVMNGIESMQAIRAREVERGGHTPIVALTAHALTGDEEKMLEAGADYYITKPINPAVLLAKISEILSKQPMSAANG